ncbi:MAG: hypothetical protein RIS52_1053 [Pseudomonadota bacterium]
MSRLATIVLSLFFFTTAALGAPHKKEPLRPKAPWGLVVHGGAGAIERGTLSPEKEAAMREGLDRALKAGSAILAKGGSAIDAVQAAVAVLEDDPNFNAGRGAVLTYDGTIAHDAAIMDGQTRMAGSVAGIVGVKNPIFAARRVMDKSPNVMLSGTGATDFAIEQGLETAGQDYFETPERREQLETMKAQETSAYDVEHKYGTVGAVAVDQNGHVAAATSTGGLTGKRWGRIGDSPIIGAGTYADDRACAVSATGAGEYFIRLGVAHEICARVRLKGERIVPAARAVMDEVKALGGTGGVIVITPDGQIGWSFNTPGMYRGAADSTGRTMIAIYSDE